MKNHRKIRVGITHGDINGIGYEVIMKVAADNRLCEICTPVFYGSAKVAGYYRKALDMQALPFHQIKTVNYAKDGMFNVINVIEEEVKVDPGQSTKVAGEAAFAALEAATLDLREGDIDVLVTAPINKHNIQSHTFTFPGHTEYLEASVGNGQKALMILCNERMRVALVTTHLPIAKVPSAITKDLVVARLEAFDHSLRRDFGVQNPRIAVLSLNPHAGEKGLLGHEEEESSIPAIQEAYDKKILCFGPYAADGFFGSGNYKHFDGILAMYHDQGLAPFKTIAMESGVNFTAGLPVVRTSPDHGTGYDIAGKGLADESSMREAIYTAIDVFNHRQAFDEAIRNPLRKQYFEKGNDNVVLDLTKDDDDDIPVSVD
ncbi:MAG: 4-hydroxythreonine-4-phosphate dehydrogenase PdxA [Muribaculaceae bacterium]|nr:4-hydroxythreonine-4-phosphate dehydrogenase PdxA [Muribaculaceae bacterium]